MRGYLVISIITTIVIGTFGLSQNVFGETYEHEFFTIEYPDGWQVQVESGDELLGGFEFVKFADKLPNYSAKVVVVQWPDILSGYVVSDLDLMQFNLDGAKWWCETSTFDDVGRTCSDYEVLEYETVNMNGLESYQYKESFTLVWKEATDPEQWRSFSNEYYLGNDGYTVYGEVWLPSYDEYFDDVEASLQSFKFDQKFIEEKSKDVSPVKERVPGWIKNNAKWWSDGQISDSDFTSGIQYLIKENIISIQEIPKTDKKIESFAIPDTTKLPTETAEAVPDWVRNNAGWWADGLISEDDFLNGIKYLVEQGIIKV